MKLWLVKRTDDTEQQWDIPIAFVVRAENEPRARQIASSNPDPTGYEQPESRFLDATFATCTELTADGEPGVILEDFKRG